MPTVVETERTASDALMIGAKAVRSTWASSPISISGTFQPKEWAGAGIMPMPDGFIWVKNDSKFLYFALDLVHDTGKSPGVGDYFWLTFDVDRDCAITPRHDVNYGIYPTLPIRIARQYCLGPGVWTTILPGPTTSAAQQGFGPTANSAAPHRIWEMRIALSEIGVSLAKAVLPILRFGLRTSSTTPAFKTDFPPNFYNDFSKLPEIYLATGPETVYTPGTEGPTIAGVGLIPFTVIANGRATTAPSYNPYVINAAFGGIVNFVYNRQTIRDAWNRGARCYKILHRTGTSGAFASLRRTWSNYRWTGTSFVLEGFGPDAQDRYELRDPSLEYSTKDLLFQMDTAGWTGAPALATGLHEWEVEFFKMDNTKVVVPAQILRLFVDNTVPEVNILDVTYKGATVGACSIVNIDETSNDPVRIRYRAYDAEGDLLSYHLHAFYGGPMTPPIELLPSGMGAYPGGGWTGEADAWIDAPVTPNRFPPVSCAYQLRLSAYPRVTDGYHYIGYSEADFHATFQRSAAHAFTKPHAHALLGFMPDAGNPSMTRLG